MANTVNVQVILRAEPSDLAWLKRAAGGGVEGMAWVVADPE